MEVIGFSLKDCLSSLSCIRLMIPQKLTSSDEKRKCKEQLKEIQKRYPEGLPLMDPIEDMHIIGKHAVFRRDFCIQFGPLKYFFQTTSFISF